MRLCLIPRFFWGGEAKIIPPFLFQVFSFTLGIKILSVSVASGRSSGSEQKEVEEQASSSSSSFLPPSLPALLSTSSHSNNTHREANHTFAPKRGGRESSKKKLVHMHCFLKASPDHTDSVQRHPPSFLLFMMYWESFQLTKREALLTSRTEGFFFFFSSSLSCRRRRRGGVEQ